MAKRVYLSTEFAQIYVLYIDSIQLRICWKITVTYSVLEVLSLN